MAPSLAPCLVFFAALGRSLVSARDIPGNLQDFYRHVRDQGQCGNVLAGGFHSTDSDDGDYSYCGDFLDNYHIIYLQGKHGDLVNLDVDCDGAQHGRGDDGRCGSSDDTQSQTSFQGEMMDYGTAQKDLNANIHPYVVFGNSGSKPDWPEFDPQDYGVQPLSVMAVVCNGKLVYGIWGDTNGDDGNEAMVGEASISLATACFGDDGVSGNSGHDENDVLFIAFVGHDAVPGSGADWDAHDPASFEESIASLGDKLVERIGSGCGAKGLAAARLWLACSVLGVVVLALFV